MYPFLRMWTALLRVKSREQADIFAPSETDIRIYPWDIDIFMELNNGRTLTLYDIPRTVLAKKIGLWEVIRKGDFGITVAGSAVVYRKRITVFQKITMTAQFVGVDDRFIYIVQNTYRKGEPCGQSLVRMAIFDKKILPPREFMYKEFGDITIPELPEWVQGYVKAASFRPWPPNGDE